MIPQQHPKFATVPHIMTCLPISTPKTKTYGSNTLLGFDTMLTVVNSYSTYLVKSPSSYRKQQASFVPPMLLLTEQKTQW